MEIVVIDLGVGNVKSLKSAIDYLGLKSKLSKKEIEIENATHLILAGVGSFDSIIEKIENSNLKDVLFNCVIKKKIPILGICVGMQVFFNSSEEGIKKGLDFFNAKVKKLEPNNKKKNKVPNVGFHRVKYDKKFILFEDLKVPYFYFTHSYANQDIPIEKDYNIAVCKHEKNFVAAIQKENIFGVQFHPEKSQSSGLRVLKNFFNYR